MKRVLIITYYWPPSGGVAVLRNLKFVKYLRNFGWEPVVFAPEGAHYQRIESMHFNEIPEGIEIIKNPIWEPFSLFKKFTGRKKDDNTNPVYMRESKSGFLDKMAIWIRGNFFVPDARSLWIKPSVKYLSEYLEKNKVDAILTGGPPHSNTVIGLKLAEKFNIPWLADFQDPWTQVDYYEKLKIGRIADSIHKKLEQKTFNLANQITIVSPTWAKELEEIGAKNVEVVYYGYDESDFAALKPNNSDYFIISHAGILGNDRSPDTFLKVLADICKSNRDFKNKLQIKFNGAVDYTIDDKIKQYGLEENYNFLGMTKREEALQLMLDSNILLLPVNKAENAKGRLPGKIYEYLRANKPILALGEKDSDVASILKSTQAGVICEYDDYDGIKKFVLDVFLGKSKFNSTGITAYTSENQTRILASYLDDIV